MRNNSSVSAHCLRLIFGARATWKASHCSRVSGWPGAWSSSSSSSLSAWAVVGHHPPSSARRAPSSPWSRDRAWLPGVIVYVYVHGASTSHSLQTRTMDVDEWTSGRADNHCA